MSNKGDAVVIGILRSLAIFYFSIAIILATAAAVVAFLAHKPGIVHVGFALPAVEHTSVTWHAEVDAFSNRVSGAFGVRKTTANEFASWILEASRRQRIDAETLASLVLTESSFRKDVRSHVGAVGPAQVRPEYWSRFCGSSNLHDPAENIYCGAQVLSHYLDRCKDDMDCALVAYNVGPYSKREQAGQRYVSKVSGYRQTLRDYSL